MGADHSKPSSDSRQHVFSSDHPVRFSNEIMESLQKNTFRQTNSARSHQQELDYQQRLAAELEKVREGEARNFARVSESLFAQTAQSAEPLSNATATTTTTTTTSQEKNGGEKKKEGEKKQSSNELSKQSVAKEIDQLRAKLEKRKKREQANENVSMAKEAVVACLRTNDRRPLDCWKEVETFKQEVGWLEKEFVESTIR